MYNLQIEKEDYSGHNNAFFEGLCQFKSIKNNQEFNQFCKWIIQNWDKPLQKGSEQFRDYLEKADIKTPWGGVYITEHQHPRVKKYLLVKQGNYLAFEKHEQKEEKMEVQEGGGILLKREGDTIKVIPFNKGDDVSFNPGDEHCVIALDDMTIFENSLDHKGMDQDLIFIFTPA